LTIVIAKRRQEEILFLTDTMVDEPAKTGPDIFPGRLKAVTIGPRVTIAFAGNADPAGVAVRTARRELRLEGLMAAVEVLRCESSSGGTDFLVAVHDPKASLIRLRKGAAVEVRDTCALGRDESFRDIIDQARTSRNDEPLKSSDLRSRFNDKLMTNKGLGPYVGGFPIAVEALPTVHRYVGCSGGYTYKFPELKWGAVTHQPIEQLYTGDGHFTLSVVPSEAIDVPVVGACLLQARMGYVFSPIERPEAFSVRLAPPNSLWKGKEQQMYSVLKEALASHVVAVAQS
jgi:hypothetical protein